MPTQVHREIGGLQACRIVMRTFVLTCTMPFLGSSAQAAPAAYSYAMTGETFVQMLHQPESPGTMNREKAYSYLDGIKDATEGRAWCDIDQLKTPDLAYDLAGEISRMTPSNKKRNAAVLLLDLLRHKFPCPGETRGKS